MMDFFGWLVTDGPSYLWKVYNKNIAQVNGILSSLTVLITAVVLFFTARAANAAKGSAEVSLKTLKYTQDNSRREEFINHFTLLLEQHNEQLNIVKKYLDEETEKYLNENTGKRLLVKVNKANTLKEACGMLRGHSIISPYMRVLYHLLKHISKSFYKDGECIDDKKKYSSIVRSLIRNDVLFLVAVNASCAIADGKENDYAKYQKLLHEFKFFEHALFFSFIKKESQNDGNWLEGFHSDIMGNICFRFLDILNEDNKGNPINRTKIPTPFMVSCIFNNPSHQKSIEMIHSVIKDINSFIITKKEEFLNKLKEESMFENRFSSFENCRYIDEDFARENVIINDEITLDEFNSLPKINLENIERLIRVYGVDFERKVRLAYIVTESGVVKVTNLSGLHESYKAMINYLERYDKVNAKDLTIDIVKEQEYWRSCKTAILNQRVSLLKH